MRESGPCSTLITRHLGPQDSKVCRPWRRRLLEVQYELLGHFSLGGSRPPGPLPTPSYSRPRVFPIYKTSSHAKLGKINGIGIHHILARARDESYVGFPCLFLSILRALICLLPNLPPLFQRFLFAPRVPGLQDYKDLPKSSPESTLVFISGVSHDCFG